jgi:hypothetical protein
MPSDEWDPELESSAQEFISVSHEILRAIVSEARGSIRYKNSIAISLDWPERLPKHPLSEQIAQHIAAAREIGIPCGRVFPNETAALGTYLQDFLFACNVTVGNFLAHGAELLDRRTQRMVVGRILDALLPQSELAPNTRVEIPGIDLKWAVGVIRYGHAHKVTVPRIVYWFQQEWPWHAIVTEVREGGLPPGYPMATQEGPELGGHGPRIAEVLRHSIDSDLGLDLARIANWMENGRWPLSSTPGEILAVISDTIATPAARRFQFPLVELFCLFGLTRELRAWLKELSEYLKFNLQNLADYAVMRVPELEVADVASSELDGTSAQTAAAIAIIPRPTTGSSMPKAIGPPQRSREPDPRKQLIATIKSSGHSKAKKIAELMDVAIEKISDPVRRNKCAPLDEWRPLAPAARSWVEFVGHARARAKVRNYINKIKPLPLGITKKRA